METPGKLELESILLRYAYVTSDPTQDNSVMVVPYNVSGVNGSQIVDYQCFSIPTGMCFARLSSPAEKFLVEHKVAGSEYHALVRENSPLSDSVKGRKQTHIQPNPNEITGSD